MAKYEDLAAKQNDVSQRVRNLLTGNHSIEVVPGEKGLVLRVWMEPHCDPNEHESIGPAEDEE